MPGSGPYVIIRNVVGNPLPQLEHFVALPTEDDTPGNPGDYAVDVVNRKVVHYTGDGVSNHSWAAVELVQFNP